MQAEDDLAGLLGDEEGEDGLADPDAVEMALDADEGEDDDDMEDDDEAEAPVAAGSGRADESAQAGKPATMKESAEEDGESKIVLRRKGEAAHA